MLIVVPTPIGNLKDITIRALDTLKTVDYILAENSVHSRKLCNAYAITTRLVAFHRHNETKSHEKF
jgi:16S rRNA (cytidine1402-2'-O)-methyltransferase